MRLLFVCPYLPTPSKRRQLNYILHLAQRHELHLRVVATGREIDGVVGSAALIERLRGCCASFEVLRVPWPALLLRGGWRYFRGDALRTAYTTAHERFANELNRACDKLAVDVVHVDRLRLARLASAIQRPTVVDLPDCMSWALSQWAEVARGLRRLAYKIEARRLRVFEAQMLSRCPAALVASEEDGFRVHDSGYTGETNVVPGIIDFLGDGTNAAPVSNAGPLLVFHGNLFYTPNIDAITFFVQTTFPELRRCYRTIELAIVGAEPSRSVRALDRVEGVRVIGNVDAMSPWLRAATAVVAPMRIGAGHSQKIGEAMIERRPVICTPHAAQRVATEVRSHLLIASRPQDWIEHVGSLLDNPAGGNEIGERGCAAVRKAYSADAVVPILEDVYARYSRR